VHVLEAPASVVAHLRRGGAYADQLTRRFNEREALAQLSRQELRLVETPLPQPGAVQRHGDRPTSRQPFYHEALSHQQRERLRKPPPALVLEALEGDFDRAFVCRRRAQPRERLQPAPAPAVLARRLDLRTAPAA
jgi:hypothetical protein